MNKEKKSKVLKGQFFTKHPFWFNKITIDFINKINYDFFVDPFAGDGDLLKKIKSEYSVVKVLGYDIDSIICERHNWNLNDNIINPIFHKNAIFITNPPYLFKGTAKRKKIYDQKQFNNFSDLYLSSIDSILKFNDFLIAIIPETFLNNRFFKNRLESFNIIEDKMFNDTDHPVGVAIFNKNKNNDAKIYKNSHFVMNYSKFIKYNESVLVKDNDYKITFNDKNGNIFFQAFDSTKIDNKIKIQDNSKVKFNGNKIKNTTRMNTLISINHDIENINYFVELVNKKIEKLRKETQDIVLTPFKGNNNINQRRRRLNYTFLRKIITEVLNENK